MTPADFTLLRSLAAADAVTFMPEDHTAAVLARFEATMASRDLQKAGWIELEIAEERKRPGGPPPADGPGSCGSVHQGREGGTTAAGRAMRWARARIVQSD